MTFLKEFATEPIRKWELHHTLFMWLCTTLFFGGLLSMGRALQGTYEHELWFMGLVMGALYTISILILSEFKR